MAGLLFVAFYLEPYFFPFSAQGLVKIRADVPLVRACGLLAIVPTSFDRAGFRPLWQVLAALRSQDPFGYSSVSA